MLFNIIVYYDSISKRTIFCGYFVDLVTSDSTHLVTALDNTGQILVLVMSS